MKLKQVKVNIGKYQFPLYVRSASKSDKIMMKELQEEHLYNSLFKLAEGELSVDVGSYLAETSIMMSLYGAKRVLSYEVHPVLFKIGKQNIKLNKLTNVELNNIGLGDKKETKIIKGRPTMSFGLGNSPFLDPEKDFVKAKMVDTQSELKRIIKKHKEIQLLKVDIEGNEKFVIPRIDEKLSEKIKNIIVECHTDKIKEKVQKHLASLKRKNKIIISRKLKSNTVTIILSQL